MELTDGRLTGLNFAPQAVRSSGKCGARAGSTVQLALLTVVLRLLHTEQGGYFPNGTQQKTSFYCHSFSPDPWQSLIYENPDDHCYFLHSSSLKVFNPLLGWGLPEPCPQPPPRVRVAVLPWWFWAGPLLRLLLPTGMGVFLLFLLSLIILVPVASPCFEPQDPMLLMLTFKMLLREQLSVRGTWVAVGWASDS